MISQVKTHFGTLVPRRENLVADLTAGLTIAVVNIPAGLATGILAGVNPVYGLYPMIYATPVGALFTGSVFMNVSVTSAMAVAIAEVMGSYSGAAIGEALFTLTLLVGAIELLLGLLRLGELTRFISNAVMTGFLAGIAVTIILGQLSDLTGYSSQFSGRVLSTVDLAFNLGQVDPATTAIGVTSILLVVALSRTRFSQFSMVIAVVLGTAAVQLFNLNTVQLVGDIAEIPDGLPPLTLPNLRYIPDLIIPAIAISIIGLVQGAGISQGVPNPDGKYPDTSQDFLGQGAANIFSSFFQSMPGGASMSSTALVVSAGAKSRWVNIFQGLIVAIIVILFSGLISFLPMPSMAALLIIAAVQSLHLDDVFSVWQSGWGSGIIMMLTFLATLVIPLQQAVMLGVFISIIVFVYRSSADVAILQLVQREKFVESTAAPERLPSEEIIVLAVEGNLFFAGAVTFEKQLPDPADAERPMVILRLRGHKVGSTFLKVIDRYNKELRLRGGRLYLAGISDQMFEQLSRTGYLDSIGPEDVFQLTGNLGESTYLAREAAQEWLDEQLSNDAAADQ